MGLLDYGPQEMKKVDSKTLLGRATRLLKRNGQRRKTRRGKGSKKKSEKQLRHEKEMQQYQLQKKQRAEMFKEFERLIAE